jgi:hypothetical protein
MKKLINFDSNDPETLQRSQKTIITIGIIVLVIIVTFATISSDKKKKQIKLSMPNGNAKNKIDIASSINVKAEDEWLNKSENDLKSIQQQNESFKKQIELLREELETNRTTSNNIANSLAQEIANLRLNQYNNDNNNQPLENDYDEYGQIIPTFVSSNIQTIEIDLEPTENPMENTYNDIENYIPAGSYATARMLSGADVSTGVNSTNDPNNMMFEIISPAIAPKYKGKSQEIKKIEGCRLQGAAIGQLWTEKTYVRLLKMSCSFERGKVAEFNVKGYVTSFAKEGIRGKVVSREGYFTSMAFLAGAVEGLADITKTAYSPTLEVSSGIATESLNSSDVFKSAGAGGFGKAAEMLSDYYIKRAEQYQSVIDVPTGVEVEIVFQEGVDLTTNTSFRIKPNDIGRQLGSQIGQDINSINSRSNASYSNNRDIMKQADRQAEQIRNSNNNGSNVYGNNDNGVF